MDIHHYEKQYATCMKRLKEGDLSNGNRETILKFVNSLILEGISKQRIVKYICHLRTMSKMLPCDFSEANEEHIKDLVATLQQMDKYTAWTKQNYKVVLRKFYKWVKGTKNYPDIVSWISIRIKRSEMNLPSEGDLLSEEDIKKLITVAEHPRDKAFISVLWESGARVGEVGNLKLKHLTFDKYGVLISVKGKTGSRKIRLMASTGYLGNWIDLHPQKADADAPLWINIGATNKYQNMEYGNMRMLLKRLFRKAGINKRQNPHLFRHSRATFMAHHLTEFQMNQYFGWIQGSNMPSTYVHMSGRDVDNAILAMNGVEAEGQKKQVELKPKTCPRCHEINAPDSRHCRQCGGIVDSQYAMEIEAKQLEQENMRKMSDQLMNMLFKDPEFQKLVMQKISAQQLT